LTSATTFLAPPLAVLPAALAAAFSASVYM
jgi:hypothetical protein